MATRCATAGLVLQLTLVLLFTEGGAGEDSSLYARLNVSSSLLSRDYPFWYYSYERRLWSISSDKGYVVHLHIVDIDLQVSNTCINNTVTVYDSDQVTELAQMCNSQYKEVSLYSTGDMLYVHYTTSEAQQGSKGFYLHYRAVPPSEGSDSTATESPEFPTSSYVFLVFGFLVAACYWLAHFYMCGICARPYCEHLFSSRVCQCSTSICPPRTRTSLRLPPTSPRSRSTFTRNATPASAGSDGNRRAVFVLPGSQPAPADSGHANPAFSSRHTQELQAYNNTHHNPASLPPLSSRDTDLLQMPPAPSTTPMMMPHLPGDGRMAWSVVRGKVEPGRDAVETVPTEPPLSPEPTLVQHCAPATAVRQGAAILALDDTSVVQLTVGESSFVWTVGPGIDV